ncbi:sigma-54-dependent Fis family transcriptional regulator [Parasulfuritortus cantonensis]|uniref:Sigma-54-dependent Fis family transcriptional regulator n=1 Tax=Parasulfuritortus cantonensis TaxID=2528202 RepID=A0A4R1BE28_9PROT|nr:sigma-54 dependent transcriptional regulator [Parasulfuritortus cantonensis]TCJ15351.1 sigma-54-dependent Fis family transcriptional regulator [Parasulfuritortus cantonensis]
MTQIPTVLIVDDEPDLLDLADLTLARMGLNVERAADVTSALAHLNARQYDLCLTDMRLPDGDGLEIVRHIGAHAPFTPVAVLTAFGSAENAVAALKAGAFDYLSKPVSLEQLRSLVRTALRVPHHETGGPRKARLIGDSPPMRQIRAKAEKLARSQAPVFITGESGTGKEVAARLIHELGPRAGKPFLAVNCGAIPENLMESEFFGYRKGAFTGAESDRDGFFQAANGGTLFLDEVLDLPMSMQVKLLRAFQERSVRRVGGTAEEPVDVRVISASHQDMADAVDAGRFRHDLYYRLNVIDLRMPALRERREDIEPLVEFIIERVGGGPARLAPAALAALGQYSFPGNVRELENILERALALGDGAVIEVADLDLAPERFGGDTAGASAGEGLALQDYLDQVERDKISQALEQTRGNKTAAARLLGVTFRSLRYRIERLGIEP